MNNKLLRHVHYVTSLDKHVQNYAYFWLEIYIPFVHSKPFHVFLLA